MIVKNAGGCEEAVLIAVVTAGFHAGYLSDGIDVIREARGGFVLGGNGGGTEDMGGRGVEEPGRAGMETDCLEEIDEAHHLNAQAFMP